MNPSNQPEPKKPICPDAWCIPPSPRMVSMGNDYYTCSTCGEPCDVIDLKPDTQAEVIDFVTDPETIAKAVEGSMDKRKAVQAEVGLRKKVEYAIWKFDSNYTPERGGTLAINTKIPIVTDEIMALFQADKAAAVVEAEIRAIDLLRWKYKELNNQTVDMKFVEAHTLLKDELTGKSNTTPCGYCGTPVEPVVTVTQKKYCNHSHRQLAYKARLQPPTAGEGESV